MLADIDRLNDDVVKKFREVFLHAYLDSCRIKSVVDGGFNCIAAFCCTGYAVDIGAVRFNNSVN